jgi:N-acetylglucosamine-6-phosphate deacetylase
MDVAFERAVRLAGLSLVEAAQVTALTPARVLGIDDRVGSISVGKDADLVVLSDAWKVDAVLKRGAWIAEPPAA